jgi:hypothetical protein
LALAAIMEAKEDVAELREFVDWEQPIVETI